MLSAALLVCLAGCDVSLPSGPGLFSPRSGGYTSQTARVTVSSSTKLDFRLALIAGATTQAGGVSE